MTKYIICLLILLGLTSNDSVAQSRIVVQHIDAYFQDMDFPTPKEGIVITVFHDGIRTSDSGSTWVKVKRPNDSAAMSSIIFHDSTYWQFFGVELGGSRYWTGHTRDAGSSWEAASWPTGLWAHVFKVFHLSSGATLVEHAYQHPSWPQPFDFDTRDGEVLLGLNELSGKFSLQYSSDSGRRFNSIPFDTALRPRFIRALTDSIWWLQTKADSRISTDAGKSWQVHAAPPGLIDLRFNSRGEGLGISGVRALYYTKNFGECWFTIPYQRGMYGRQVRLFENGTAYVGADFGLLRVLSLDTIDNAPLLEFGYPTSIGIAVPPGTDTMRKDHELRNVSGLPVWIDSVRITDPSFFVENESPVIPPWQKNSIEVGWKRGGSREAWMYIYSNSTFSPDSIRLSSYDITRRAELSPSILDLQGGHVGDTQWANVYLTSLTDLPLSPFTVGSSVSYLQVRLDTVLSPTRTRLQVSFTPLAAAATTDTIYVSFEDETPDLVLAVRTMASDRLDVVTRPAVNLSPLIYPNPSLGEVCIRPASDLPTDGGVQICDMLGRVVQEMHVADTFCTTLPKGVYLIRMTSAPQQFGRLLVK